MAVVVEGAAGDEVAVHHARFVHVDAAADLEIELALRHGGHPAAFHAAGARGDLHAVADAGDGQVLLEEMARDAQQRLILAEVFGRAAAAEEDAGVVGGFDVFESDLGIDAVAFPFLRDGPAGLHLVQHHLVTALLGRGDHGLIAALDEPVVGVKRVNGLRGVADDDEDLVHGGSLRTPPARCNAKANGLIECRPRARVRRKMFAG